MAPSEREIGRDHEKQKQKLDLLTQELEVQKLEIAIESKRAKENRLRRDIESFESAIQDLEKQRSTTQDGLCLWQSCFHPGTLRRKIRLLGNKSKIRGKKTLLLKARQKLTITLRYIEDLTLSVTELKLSIARGKSDWRARWPKPECCTENRCVVQRAEMGLLQAQLQEAKEQNQNYSTELDIIKMQLQATDQRIRDSLAQLELSNVSNFLTTDTSSLVSKAKSQLRDGPRKTDEANNVASASAKVVSSNLTSVPHSSRKQPVFDWIDSFANVTDRIYKHIKDTETKSKETEAKMKNLEDAIEQMQPLYGVGLATRKEEV